MAAPREKERSELLETLRAVGPDAPTLCTRWTAADIAAHLVVSEQAAGVPMVFVNVGRRVLPVAITRRIIASLLETGEGMIDRTKTRGWDELLRRLSSGPPTVFGYGSLSHLRTVEEWIHHEDVRRANGYGPRPPSPDGDEALWESGLAVTQFPEFVPARSGIELSTPDGRRHRLGKDARVRVHGRPGELLLYLAGRGEAAEVSVDGDADAITALQEQLAV